MPNTSEHRQGPDRRRQARGGRRDGDAGDFAPLVLLIGDGGPVTNMAEAVLAKLRFAVTTTKSVDEALKVLTALRPDIVVAERAAADVVTRQATESLSVVVMTEEMQRNPEALIPAIRETLRSRQPK
jgi:CheY-like chemotaxis protein